MAFMTSREKYGRAFKFKIFGRNIVAIASPTAVSNLLLDHTGSFDVINGQAIQLLSGIKTNGDRLRHLYSVLGKKAVPPVHRSLMPSRLPIISSKWTKELLKALKQIDLARSPLSLNDFVHRTLYNVTSIALLGPNFPLHTYENFRIFDEGAALQLRNLGVFARAASTARESLLACWTRHFEEHWVPEDNGYLAGASDMISDAYRGLKDSDLSQEEIHRLMFSILWAVHTNVMELTTWVMCHIITDEDIYKRVCHEIRSFVGQQFPEIDNISQIDPRLLDGDAFRFLNSVVQEVVRTKTAVGPLRVATRDAVIKDNGNKEIRIYKGEMIMINLPGMYHDQTLHEEPEVFKADRFFEGPKYKSYAFGGGKHIVSSYSIIGHCHIIFIV